MDRYFEPPTEWVACTLESRELLSLCLKRLKGLNEVQLVDAGFVWTEPHSKRLKVNILLLFDVTSIVMNLKFDSFHPSNSIFQLYF